MAKAASLLNSSVIAKKGAAAPSSDIKNKEEEGERIAVTVRLSPASYRRLKMHGLENRISNQDIIVSALDAYLSADVKS